MRCVYALCVLWGRHRDRLLVRHSGGDDLAATRVPGHKVRLNQPRRQTEVRLHEAAAQANHHTLTAANGRRLAGEARLPNAFVMSPSPVELGHRPPTRHADLDVHRRIASEVVDTLKGTQPEVIRAT